MPWQLQDRFRVRAGKAAVGRFEQRGKTILVSLDNGCELIERLLSFTRVPRFELFQPIDLQLLLRPRRR